MPHALSIQGHIQPTRRRALGAVVAQHSIPVPLDYAGGRWKTCLRSAQEGSYRYWQKRLQRGKAVAGATCPYPTPPCCIPVMSPTIIDTLRAFFTMVYFHAVTKEHTLFNIPSGDNFAFQSHSKMLAGNCSLDEQHTCA